MPEPERYIRIPASLAKSIDTVLSDAACGIDGAAGRHEWATQRILIQSSLTEALRQRPVADPEELVVVLAKAIAGEDDLLAGDLHVMADDVTYIEAARRALTYLGVL